MDDSDEALIRRSRSGDTEAFGVLVKRYAGRATSVALFWVGDHGDALDASQEAFVRAWRQIRSFRGDATFFAWYSSILRRVCLTWLRRRRNRKHVDLLEAEAVLAAGADPALLAQRNEQTERVWQALWRLSARHREIIMLRHFQELSYQQIADVLEIPVGTVMSRLHEARAALRAKLAGDQP